MNSKFLSLVLAICISIISQSLYAGCISTPRLTGVNVAGGEFNSSKVPGVHNKDYAYPTKPLLEFIAKQGANTIRLPFRWERLQPTLGSELDANELNLLRNVVTAANEVGLCVILDLHNYAKYGDQALVDKASYQSAFIDVWLRIAAAFNDPNVTAFDLMNEPSYMPITDWAKLAKNTLAALRRAKSHNMVLIAGGRWSGVHNWFTPTAEGDSNASLLSDVRDPLKRTLIEAHQYTDSNYSGTNTDCQSPEKFTAMFDNIAEWAKTNKQKLFLGEFGVPQSPECLAVLKTFLGFMTEQPWHGWTYWAAGSWWGNYPLALNSDEEAPSAQWAVLKPFFYRVNPKASPPFPPEPR